MKNKIIENEKKANKKVINRNIKLNNKYDLFELIVLMAIFGLICLLIGYFINNSENSKNDVFSNNFTMSKEIETFIEEYNYILENYYGDIDKNELISSAIKGMLSSLDEHSEFVGEDSNNFEITLEGTYQGVGIGIANDTKGNIVITQIYPNSPAEKAGLKINDIVIKFNEVDLNGKTSSELVDLIGQENVINLTVLRDNKEKTFELKKEVIVLDSVYYEMKENNIGYIEIGIFANNTYDQFKNALETLEKKGMEKLIIDVRGNTGGHLSTVERMLYLFLDNTHIIYQTQTKTETNKFYSKGKVDKKYPIVILQNSLSASASEIMAATLREELNAYIIGTTSYGKGTVQQLQSVDGIGDYKFTTKKWLTPKGNWIDGVGIVPDLEITLGVEYLEKPSFDTDSQYQAALNYLKKLD